MFEDENSPLDGHVPAFIPAEFVRSDRSLWYNKSYIGLQLFYHSSQGGFLRIELSDGAIGDLMSMAVGPAPTKFRAGDAEVALTRVAPRSAKDEGGRSLVIATWRRGDVYYRLQSNGLSMPQLEQIVSSTPR